MKHLTRLALLAALCCLSLAPLARAAEKTPEQKLLNKHQNALVTVKMLLKIKGSDQNQELEISGTMISADGLVLVSNFAIGGRVTQIKQTDIKVLIGKDSQGLPAKLLTKDPDLDLAWIKILPPKAKAKDAKKDASKNKQPKAPFAYVNLKNSVKATLGQSLMTLRKLDKNFGKAPVISYGKLIGNTTKPRKLMIVSPLLVQGVLSHPIFTQDAKLIGFNVFQFTNAQARAPFRQTGLVLSASKVAYATKKALAIAAEDDDQDSKD